MRIPILTYQTMHIDGNDYRSNDKIALSSDLRQLTAAGFKILPLRSVVDLWLDNRGTELDGKLIALASDNGADFDYLDLLHPTAGPQRSIYNILRDFAADNPGRQEGLNVTSFTIASAEARAVLDATCMLGKDWWTDRWWPEAIRSGLIHVANMSWDHNHETLPSSFLRSARSGTFLTIDSQESADHEIRSAAEYLRSHAPNPGAGLFAYPYGESNPYLVHEYFPTFGAELGIRAAFTTRSGFLEPGTGRWEVPRFLCGRDWSSPSELEAILDAAATQRPWVAVRRWPAREETPSTEPGGLRDFGGFVATRVAAIPGWLHPEAALFTAHLAAAQHAMQVTGPTLEIGVYKGKYLSVLYKLSQRDETVVGVDLFNGPSNSEEVVAQVRSNITTACGDASRLKIVVADSMQLTSHRILEEAAVPFRFISIDGGHTPEVVFHDLETAYPALREGGIMALDDIFNPGVPGVVEGIAEFFLRRKPALAPFAYCYNKLFVTTPQFHTRYLREALTFLDQVTWLPTHQPTKQSLRENRANNFTPTIFGYEVVSFIQA
ncbi:MAG: class I SAM-dependent methyltransferase [Usitatibacter sp.]